MFEAGTATEHYAATLANGEVITSNVPWRVTHVQVLPDFRLSVRFIDGVSGFVEMREQIFGATAGVFKTLRDPAVFSDVTAEEGHVAWASGLDLAPDAMHDEIERNGVWILR
jgi:Protein of unknown function (DUF2442)